jgi:hypothetical protein
MSGDGRIETSTDEVPQINTSPNRFEQALLNATAQLKAEFGKDLVGLLFAGSAAYGTPMPNSDVDLYVLIEPNWRQRRNRFIQGVEVEMFINPVAQIRREFDEGQWATVDMFSRGRVHYDPTGVVAQLAEDAKRIAAEPPETPGDSELYFIRYRPSDFVRDVEDLVEHDRASAEMLLGVAIQTALEAHWQMRGLHPPKPKRLLEAFRSEAPELVPHVDHITDLSHKLEDRIARLRDLCERVLEPVGGMMREAQTPPEHLSNAD